jgi:hypothetical protein
LADVQQQQRQDEGALQAHSFNIWSDTEDVLRQMVSWLAGLETVVCQGRVAAEPAAAARSRSYLSVHKVAALLAGGVDTIPARGCVPAVDLLVQNGASDQTLDPPSPPAAGCPVVSTCA